MIRRFPEELLSDTPDAKKNYFQNYYVLHPKLKDATDMLINAIKNSAGFSIILLIGPTGVGKTTLIKKVIKQITNEAREDMNKDKSLIPIVCVEATSPIGNLIGKTFQALPRSPRRTINR